ncbi:MAG: hypothetical protein LC723_13420 [Actinobacteria bacterium]|nr:hypothetical protein [Actinomycetota bacterium]
MSKAWDWNDQGGGVAWIDGKSVRWKKGLGEDEMQELCRTLPLPYVAHFRIASVGVKSSDLCHPFPMHKDVPTALEGRTPKGVLFHNGTWGKWKGWTLEACVRRNTEMPEGLWNDTRALAWFASLYGVPILEVIDEKTAVVRPTGVEIFGNGWGEEGGILVSNKIFLNQTRHRTQTHGGHSGTGYTVLNANKGTGGSPSAETTFRGSGPIVLPGKDVEDAIQEALQDFHSRDGESEGTERPAITPVKSPLEGLRRSPLATVGTSTKPGFRSVAEAAAEAKSEREKRLAAARRNITYIGES